MNHRTVLYLTCLLWPALNFIPQLALGQSRDPEHYQLLVRDKVQIKGGAYVAGNVGVNSPEGSLKLSHDSVVADGRELVADKVRIQPPNARAFDVFANLLHLGKGAIVGGTITQPVSPPIYDPEPLVLPDPFDPANFPPAFPITCGGPDRVGGTGESFVLTPGSYGTVSVGTNGKVTLQAGTYEFCSLVVVKYGGIFVEAPATINVRDVFRIGPSSGFVPMGNANQIQVNVQGVQVKVASYSTFGGRLFAPKAKLAVGGLALVTGHMVAQRLVTDGGTHLFTCGNGALDAGEQCDASAPGGDQACPGTCVAPGLPNECTCSGSPPTTTTTTEPTTTSTTTTTIAVTTTTVVSTTTTTTPASTTTTTVSTTTTTEPTTTTTTVSTTTTTTLGSTTTTTLSPTTTTEPTTTSTTTTTIAVTTTTVVSTTTSTTLGATTTTTVSTTTTTQPTTTSTTTTTVAVTTTTVASTTTTTTTTVSTTTTTTLPPCAPAPTSISSNFNGTPIRENNFIWFSSVLKAQGLGSNPVTVRFDAQTIQFSAAGNPFVLNVPNASITFSPTATLATTTFNTVANEWETVVPSSGLSGNDFVSGLAFEVPFDFPGGINPVIWSGTFSSDTPGVSINWQWAAAVYTMFSTDYNLLGVKPVDDNMGSVYLNSDHAGTPENFKTFVTGGARGGGGSNFTGSLSATAGVSCP